MARLFATFTFTFEDDRRTSFEVVETNINADGVVNLLETYLHSIIGAGKDPHEAIERDMYKITVAVELAHNDFTVTHDCGNLSLVAGILNSILGRLLDNG